MPFRTLAFAAFAFGAQLAAAQQPQPQPQQQLPSLQQLLAAGYDLKSALLTLAPCGDQPANRAQECRREVLFLQSATKDAIFRCERGMWNGRLTQECRRY